MYLSTFAGVPDPAASLIAWPSFSLPKEEESQQVKALEESLTILDTRIESAARDGYECKLK